MKRIVLFCGCNSSVNLKKYLSAILDMKIFPSCRLNKNYLFKITQAFTFLTNVFFLQDNLLLRK